MRLLFYIRDFCMQAYGVSLKDWIVSAAILIMAWSLLMLLLKRQENIRLFLGRVLASLGLLLIIIMTFVRYPYQGTGLIWIPLRPLLGMKVNSDYWFVSITNLILYIPFACGLSFSGEREKKKKAVGTTLFLCFMISVTAEIYQYTTASGLAEVDDVLFNTLGGLAGASPRMLFPEARRKKAEKSREDRKEKKAAQIN